ncbi:MHYT domain-containing protein [Coralliovum pocilloporae]|uniref:MHYT domain-containing protein n=1 Tax=Coralliovum pocilloporae TaxID=3066369 RepID=UPI003307BF32
MLTYTYDITLVVASLAISMMAAFTGLTLTNGISALPVPTRKLIIGMAAIVLGGGIWSMHFVAILALQLPVPVIYDSALTLGSILIAILMAGTSLLFMHFGERNWRNIIIAGAILGNGIVVMHYVGMSGIQGCLVLFGWSGRLLSVLLATLTGIAAIWIAYRERTRLNIILSTLIFGSSVVIVHFTAMYWTGFAVSPDDAPVSPSIENADLALIVILAGFFICGGFLLSAATFLMPKQKTEPAASPSEPDPEAQSEDASDTETSLPDTDTPLVRIPYERDGKTYFLPLNDVAAIRAEGHYTLLYTETEKLFCPWSISVAEKRLPDTVYLKTHRSYLVNISHVSGFERRKDNGACLFDHIESLKTVPVSRTRVNPVREALGL